MIFKKRWIDMSTTNFTATQRRLVRNLPPRPLYQQWSYSKLLQITIIQSDQLIIQKSNTLKAKPFNIFLKLVKIKWGKLSNMLTYSWNWPSCLKCVWWGFFWGDFIGWEGYCFFSRSLCWWLKGEFHVIFYSSLGDSHLHFGHIPNCIQIYQASDYLFVSFINFSMKSILVLAAFWFWSCS